MLAPSLPQVVSGSFKMQSLDGVTSEYANVQNIVARLGPAEPSEHSVLVNCHFDTAIGSPGGWRGLDVRGQWGGGRAAVGWR